MATDLTGIRVLIAHDWLTTWAGSERVVEQMLRAFPNADIVVGLRSERLGEDNDVTKRAQQTWLARIPGAHAHHRWFLPLQALAFATFDTRGYDVVLSSSHAFSKMIRPQAGVPHVCYCHSPPRYLWDLQATYRMHASILQQAALTIGGPVLRGVDRLSARRVDRFIANSRYIKNRIHRIYRRDAAVVYPPVSQKPRASRIRREGFLLTLGRLVPYKRVDLIIRAAEKLGIPLVVAGDGPQRNMLEGIASKHTEFVGTVSEVEAGRLLSSCSAFVFCAEEDFGITPVEANAHGAPVVAYRAGGAAESMVAGETAVFFDRQTVDEVAEAIRRAMNTSWSESVLRQNARRFSPRAFRTGLLTVVRDAVGSRCA